MGTDAKSSGPVRFGVFEADLLTGELRKNGQKVRLQDQPFRVLALLLQRAGELVAREEIQNELWPGDTFVEFDHGLNTAIKKIRQALGDSAETPRLIETLPRRGYRFIAPVDGPAAAGSAPGSPAPGTGPSAAPSLTSTPDHVGAPHAVPESVPQRPQRFLQIAISALVVLAVGIIIGMWVGRPGDPGRPADASVLRFAFTPGVDVSSPVISPNGRHIAYTVGRPPNTKLWVQDLDRDAPREIEGTEGVRVWVFWSPGSDFIGFTTTQDVKKVPVEGGPVAVLCQLPPEDPSGGAWSPDGDSIIFGSFAAGLYEVPARGGSPKPLFEPEEAAKTGEFAHPHFLPLAKGPRMLLFRVNRPEPRIVLRNLDTGNEQVLAEGSRPFYSPSGHIVYQTSDGGGGLWALPFSIDSLKSTGEPFPIARNAQFASIAATGTLTYFDPPEGGQVQLVWRNRQGEKLGVLGQPQKGMWHVALSPDGRRVAVVGVQGGNFDIWLHDTARPIKTRLTTDPGPEFAPIWSPSGDQVAFNTEGISRISADGSGEATQLLATPAREAATDWSPDGKYILYLRWSGEANSGGRELWYLRRKEDGSGYEEVPFLQTPFKVQDAQFSPDGGFVAYLSDESGTKELYVTPFPSGDVKWSISTNGARQPLWNPDGKELFYVEGRTLVAVAVKTRPNFSVGLATRLFQSDYFRPSDSHTYDVSADGQRFVIPDSVEGAEPPTIRVVQNWYEEFRDREQD